MKLSKNSIISVALFTMLVATLMGLEEFFEGEISGEGVLEEVGFYLGVLILLLLTVVTPGQKIIIKLNRRLPWESAFLKRFALEAFWVLVISAITGFLSGEFIHHFIEHTLPTFTVITRAFLFMLIVTSLLVALLEVMLISEDRDRLKGLSEKLEKQNVISLFNALKNEVNPHFLYNSLNILASLIEHDKKLAEKYVLQLSDLYGKILMTKDQTLVSVHWEMDLLHTYLLLQKTRFGEKLTVNVNAHRGAFDRAIPPLALQTVVENAIKHNEISADKPLTITISGKPNLLRVENPIQPRKGPVDSTGTGIENVKQRYALISDFKPEFSQTETTFTATLPLINE